jgi:xanthine dehydrogenase accessory factor
MHSDSPADQWLYREKVSPPWAFWIAGAGHIAQAVAPLAAQLDFAVTVFDDRPALASHHFFPKEVTMRAAVWDELLEVALPAEPCFGLIVTRGHRHDALVLKSWIQKPFVFLGMIGSKRKARTIFEHFIDEKMATPELSISATKRWPRRSNWPALPAPSASKSARPASWRSH